MEIVGVIERVERIAAVRIDPAADADLVRSGLVAVREVRAWLDAQHAGLVAQLRVVDSFPEKSIADAAKTSLGQAAKSTERATTLDRTPTLADALGDGAITAEHIDAVTRVSKKLDGARRGEFVERANGLAEVAKAGTVVEFSRRLELEAKRLQEDDGVDRLERQRRSARANSWVDPEGMWNLRARFDPLTGVKVAARIDAMVQAMFADVVPDGCPSDPIEKQRYLTAQATARLLLDEALGDSDTDGDGDHFSTNPEAASHPTSPHQRSGRPEFVVVIDADAPGSDGPVAEFSIPIEIPTRVLATLAGDADTHAVVVRNGVVLYAPGQLDLGRSSRLANRAQRRALRGLYRSCGIPGCAVAYDRCKLHHIIWWRNGGTTDLHNLLPVCSMHHAKIHNDDWHIELGPNRELTLTLPDGTTHTTSPPTRRQPAA
jgi:hypothetical protein